MSALSLNACCQPTLEVGNNVLTDLKRDVLGVESDVSFQFIKSCWGVSIHSIFQISPQEKVKGVQIWGMGRPLVDCLFANDPVPKHTSKEIQGQIRSVGSGAVLLVPRLAYPDIPSCPELTQKPPNKMQDYEMSRFGMVFLIDRFINSVLNGQFSSYRSEILNSYVRMAMF